ncbi:thioredoxin domain-containing protein [Stenotrophomonas sp. MMGLT7]|uniref:DsbA family protein n=1 Tax=Stenotrophomonas sp. MMGLT7 TaxID=2901227 RepID=UPI001E2E078E|nr:thioredoxin domain-containing protein [Stenotrophomonas sp. MMGLT7]MCD7098757.1 DsbA family protein [Stenotrophomonas sp. MMGLT7]
MSTLRIPVGPQDHVRGNPDAAAVLVEYGDYQCPFCAQAVPAIEQLRQQFGDALCFVFRNFPLADAHPEAVPAAMTAEYAGANGRFWDAHDALYANQDQLGEGLYEAIVAEAGLPVSGLRQALRSGEYGQRIQHDFEGGVRSGVNGTPCFFVNGQRYDDADGLQGLFDAIAEATGASGRD